MTETMQQYSQAETNRLIRRELKTSYPGTSFTVRASSGAGITQTVIDWEIRYRPTSAEFDGYYSPKPANWRQGRPRRTSTPWRLAAAPGTVLATTA